MNQKSRRGSSTHYCLLKLARGSVLPQFRRASREVLGTDKSLGYIAVRMVLTVHLPGALLVRLSLVHCPKEATFRFGLETRKTGSPTCWISVRYFAVLSAMIETLSVVLRGAGYRPTCEVILVVDVAVSARYIAALVPRG
jgi:hypothetical protein